MAKRRLDTEGDLRVKRQKIEDIDESESDSSGSATEGGVPLNAGSGKLVKSESSRPGGAIQCCRAVSRLWILILLIGKSEPLDPKSNPYLAHHYEEPIQESGYNGYSNGYQRAHSLANGMSSSSVTKMPRHRTDAAMAKLAEDGPKNPFNGQPLSSQYFNILKTRRNLPVHAQR